MRNLLLILLLGVNITAFAQKRTSLMKEIKTHKASVYSYKVNVAKSAQYHISYDELWDHLYVVMSERYSIAKESKTKGYIESEKKSWTEARTFVKPSSEYKDFIAEAEIIGDSVPYKLILKFEGENRTYKSSDSTWTTWIKYRDYSSEDLIRIKLYERINGNIEGAPEMSADLLNRIEAYNLKETKDKNKILPGRDY